MALRVALSEAGRMMRRNRSPMHTFQVQHIPFAIQPFCIAPVLPGETLKNLIFQSRCVSDPIKNPLVGWWLEHYFFYVKLTDMNLRETMTQMVINPNFDPNVVSDVLGETAQVWQYFSGGAGQINWVQACLEVCVREYFRDEGDDWNTHTITDGVPLPIAQIGRKSVLDSMARDADRAAGVDVGVTVGVDDIVTAREMEEAMRMYAQLKDFGLAEMTFEDYLASQGVRPPTTEIHKPELIRYSRQWTYPTNTIDPTNGTPRSAVSWSVAERASKQRFIKEPGFIFGVSVARPKVYIRNQTGTAASSLNGLFHWLPKAFQADAEASWVKVADAVGPFGAISSDVGGWWFDAKDLFLYGEQFTNRSLAGTDLNLVDLPTADLTNRDYVPTLANIQEFFVNGGTGDYHVRQDGVVSLTIASTIGPDTSPRGSEAAEIES